MKRFMSSAAPSSFSNAEQPTTSLGSAEQPGTRCQLKLSSIRDVQRWLAMEPIASCTSADKVEDGEAERKQLNLRRTKGNKINISSASSAPDHNPKRSTLQRVGGSRRQKKNGYSMHFFSSFAHCVKSAK